MIVDSNRAPNNQYHMRSSCPQAHTLDISIKHHLQFHLALLTHLLQPKTGANVQMLPIAQMKAIFISANLMVIGRPATPLTMTW